MNLFALRINQDPTTPPIIPIVRGSHLTVFSRAKLIKDPPMQPQAPYIIAAVEASLKETSGAPLPSFQLDKRSSSPPIIPHSATTSSLSIGEDTNQRKQLENTNSYLLTNMPKKGTDAWHKARSKSICASEVAGFLGLDPYMSRAKLIKAKLGKLVEKSNIVSDRMKDWGKTMEPVAISALCSLLSQPALNYGSLQHTQFLEFQGEPDALTFNPFTSEWTPLEIKCRAWPTPISATPYPTKWDVPMKHWVQVQCYMELCNSSHAYLYNWTANNGSSLYKVWRDRAFFTDFILPLIYEFINVGPAKMKTRVSSPDKARVMMALRDMTEFKVHRV